MNKKVQLQDLGNKDYKDTWDYQEELFKEIVDVKIQKDQAYKIIKEDNIEKEKRMLRRKLDRQRRSNNPNKYNENGTIKSGNKNKWHKSNKYIKTQNKQLENVVKSSDIGDLNVQVLRNSDEKVAHEVLEDVEKLTMFRYNSFK